jgi:ATP-dependent RNA circularization protein (DNA/RNA ligase family)
MNQYHKIQTVYLRDPDNHYKTLLDGQYAKPEFDYLRFCEWEWTEKVDGTNIRVMFDGETITFGGKTDRASIPAHLLNALNAQFLGLKDRFVDQFPDGVCLYGEGYGAKIQKGGGNYRLDQAFVLFDVRIGDWWLERDNVLEIATDYGIDVVPFVGVGTLPEMVEFVRRGFVSKWGDFRAEGVVARPDTELRSRNGSRIITKLKCKDFAR